MPLSTYPFLGPPRKVSWEYYNVFTLVHILASYKFFLYLPKAILPFFMADNIITDSCRPSSPNLLFCDAMIRQISQPRKDLLRGHKVKWFCPSLRIFFVYNLKDVFVLWHLDAISTVYW